MTLFDNSNHKKKVLECAWQHFETQLDHFDRLYEKIGWNQRTQHI